MTRTKKALLEATKMILFLGAIAIVMGLMGRGSPARLTLPLIIFSAVWGILSFFRASSKRQTFGNSKK
jgi:uncharacterized membrane protein YuzA (DUF378 family)